MLFSSITFLYRFLPAVLLLYAVMPRRGKNAVLLAASLIFYFWGEPKYTILLLISSLSDYLHGLNIESHRGQPSAKIALVSSVVINLLMLGVFKYLDFFIGTANTLLGTTIPQPGLKLPIGISFFTFQTMSYSIDVYRGDAKAEKNLLSFATYVCLFPQLVAGPIVRYTDVSAELSGRKLTLDRFALGARRFAVGLGKKVLIANLLGELCAVYAGAEAKTVLFAWLNALAWMLQVYYDFSGYSDMAIGLGHMLGFTFPENFNYPFCSRTITEFWRRWHMTLSGWFRDYVYIPLGGSLEKKLLAPYLEKLGPLSHIYLLAVSLVLFTVFGDNSLTNLAVMFGGGALWDGNTLYYLRSYLAVLLVSILGATPLIRAAARRVEHTPAGTILEPLATAGLLLLSTAYLVDGSFNPFLYFRF